MQVLSLKAKSISLSKKGLKSFNKLYLKQNDIKEIEELNISLNDLESTDNLSLLTNLQVLNISSNLLVKVYGLPKSLTQLNASNNKINELFIIKNNLIFQSCFDQMAYLKILDLSKNNIAKLHSNLFENCKHLSEIDLSHNKISDQLECFASLPDLTKLNLSYNKITDLNVLQQLQGCLVAYFNISANAVTKQNSQQCENLLKAILPNIQSICVSQERSLTPQPAKNQKIENNKNSSALPNKVQKDFISPFKKRLSNSSTDSSFTSLSLQRQLKYKNFSFIKQDDQQIQTNIYKDELPLSNSLVSTRQNIPNVKCLFSSQSPLKNTDNQKQNINLQENNRNEDHRHISCQQKIKILEQKQKMDQELINQQTQMIQDLAYYKICEEKKQNSQAPLGEISFKEDNQFQNQSNITYLKAKYDILLITFSKQTHLDMILIDEYIKQIVGDKVIVNSTDKFKFSNQLCNKIHSAINSK
ncbi:hypothetical protein ABPG72_009876 [Tetrahymena utriculariae]